MGALQVGVGDGGGVVRRRNRLATALGALHLGLDAQGVERIERRHVAGGDLAGEHVARLELRRVRRGAGEARRAT